MVYSLKGYKCLSVTQLVNIFVVILHDLKTFEAFRLLCAYLYLEAKQEATERTLKLKGHAVKDWKGPSTAELRSIFPGRTSIQGLWQKLADKKLITCQENKITVTQTPLPEAQPFLGLICGLDKYGGFIRSIARPVPIPHEWLLEWSKPTRSKLVPLLHLFYGAACLAFKGKRSNEVKDAATFKFETLIYYSGLHRSRWKLARKKLIDQKRVSPDTTQHQRKLNRDGHYVRVFLEWCRESTEHEKLEVGPPPSQKCPSVGHPYRDNKQASLVGRNQKRSGVSSKRNRTAPTLKNVKLSDLWDVRRLKVLFDQQSWLDKTLPNFQFFVTAAVKARSMGRKPGNLFVWLIREQKRDYVSLAHEDIALKTIAEHRKKSAKQDDMPNTESDEKVFEETRPSLNSESENAARMLARRELAKLGAKYAA